MPSLLSFTVLQLLAGELFAFTDSETHVTANSTSQRWQSSLAMGKVMAFGQGQTIETSPRYRPSPSGIKTGNITQGD
jgi:hypothetical protein